MAFNLGSVIWFRFIWGANVMIDLPTRIEAMPPCLCKSKVIGYEYSEDGFNVTHCACGGVISCTESEYVEVKKPFDITKHEFSDKDIRLSNLCESKIELAVDDCGIEHYFTLNKDDAIAIVKSLGVTGEDLK